MSTLFIQHQKGRVTGNLYELDYQKHYEHVKDVSVDHGDTKMIYENGERTQEAGKRITGGADPNLGKFLTFEEQPKDPAPCVAFYGTRNITEITLTAAI